MRDSDSSDLPGDQSVIGQSYWAHCSVFAQDLWEPFLYNSSVQIFEVLEMQLRILSLQLPGREIVI